MYYFMVAQLHSYMDGYSIVLEQFTEEVLIPQGSVLLPL